MSQLYILRNHEGQFLGKHKDWLDGSDPAALFKTPHKDEAVNQMVEISAKDYQQRVSVLACEADARGLPSLDSNESRVSTAGACTAEP